MSGRIVTFADLLQQDQREIYGGNVSYMIFGSLFGFGVDLRTGYKFSSR
jgi:hypothetical protein